ncbi:hypothetical protein [Rhodococcus sp. IEGM 1318]|uniref:hypothetical protein n=1 Tax=Rhodococcus sp. IEGM 1318 TaxID=3082226 RepID=UPI0029534B50|nr:hypothetical protein [Rhodococcus sp. IEGM 1318]MDV8009612.1 hypothetical protein [Rhodococcus sp. IEGM 1318]
MSNDDEYIEEIRVVRRKKDTYRSKSSKSKDFESDLLRSKATKNVAGPTESRRVDEKELRERYRSDPIVVTHAASYPRELTPSQQALADVLADAGIIVIREWLVPLIRDVAAPAAKAKLSEFAARQRIRALDRAKAKTKSSDTDATQVDVMEEESFASAADLEVAEPSIPITRSALMLALLQLKLAEDYAAKQRWLVSHAEVVDEDLSPELEQSLTWMLEGRANELNDKEREAVAVFLQQAENIADNKPALAPYGRLRRVADEVRKVPKRPRWPRQTE